MSYGNPLRTLEITHWLHSTLQTLCPCVQYTLDNHGHSEHNVSIIEQTQQKERIQKSSVQLLCLLCQLKLTKIELCPSHIIMPNGTNQRHLES